MAETSQIIPLYRMPVPALLESWETEVEEHAFTVAEFRRRLSPTDPDRRARFQYAIEAGEAHIRALQHRIDRAKGLHGSALDAMIPEEEPEPRSQWRLSHR